MSDETKPRRPQYMPAENERDYEEWLATRPPNIQAAARQTPLHNCYRDRARAAQSHYMLTGYKDTPGVPTEPVTGIVVHGADSYLPGVSVNGFDLSELVLCGLRRVAVADAGTVRSDARTLRRARTSACLST